MTHRRPTCRLLHCLLAVLLVAFPAWQALAQQLPIFPFAEPRIKVWKSDIDVGYAPKFFWIDNETVVFPGRPADPAMTEEERKESPLYVARWHVPSNRVTYGPEVDARFCYWRDGNVSYVTYQREHGRRIMKRGWFVEDFYFGPVDAPRKLEGDEKEAIAKDIDALTCGPRAPDPEVPHWIDTKRYNAKPMSDGWLLSTVNPPEPPRYCSAKVENLDQCLRLPFPPGTHPRRTYVEHMKGYMLRGESSRVFETHVLFIQRDQARDAWRVAPSRDAGGLQNAVFTRVGLIEIISYYGRRAFTWGGFFHVRERDRPRILLAHILPGDLLQQSVSPDGCKIVFGGAERADARDFAARVASLCG